MKIRPLLTLSHGISFALLLGLTAGFFAPRLMAYIPGILGLIFMISVYIKDRQFIKPNRAQFFFTGGLLILAGLSSLWSTNPEFSIERTIKLALIIVPSLFLLSFVSAKNIHNSQFFFRGLITLFLIASAFLIFEQTNHRLISGMAIDYELKDFHLNRSFVVYAFMALTVLFLTYLQNFKAIKGKIFALIGIVVLSLVTLYFSGSQTAQLSFLCGLIFFLFFPARSVITTKTLWAGILLLCLALPFILKPMINAVPKDKLLDGIVKEASIIYRFEVWDFTIVEIEKKPLYGHGIESQRFMKSDKWMEYQKSDSILHAHNFILQIWIEFGIVGIAFLMLFLGYLYRQITFPTDNKTRKIYITLFATILCCAMTGYGLWQSWQVGLFLFFTSLIISLAPKEKIKKL